MPLFGTLWAEQGGFFRSICLFQLLSFSRTSHGPVPKLWQESIIDEAIEPFKCSLEEQEQCCQEFYTQQHLTSETARQTWLQQQSLTEKHLIHLATRKLRIEKFKRATWATELESYFQKRRPEFDQVLYSLIRVKEANIAEDLFSRLRADGKAFPSARKVQRHKPMAWSVPLPALLPMLK